MSSETVVSTFLVASITGAGLVLAIYALITPISQKIFKERENKLNGLLKEFEKEKKKITADSSKKEYDKLKNLGNEIKQYKFFPRYLGIGVLLTFFLFMLEAILDWFELFEPTTQIAVGAFFIVGLISFLVIGTFTIAEIFDMMLGEFKEVNKKQKEVKDYKPLENLTIIPKSETHEN
jgi:hypothetical protein